MDTSLVMGIATVLRDACSNSVDKDREQLTRTFIERAKYNAGSSSTLHSNGMHQEALRHLALSVQDALTSYLLFVEIVSKEKGEEWIRNGVDVKTLVGYCKSASDFCARYYPKSSSPPEKSISAERIMNAFESETTGTAKMLKSLQKNLEKKDDVAPLLLAFGGPGMKRDEPEVERISEMFKGIGHGRGPFVMARHAPFMFAAAAIVLPLNGNPGSKDLFDALPELLKRLNRSISGFEALLAIKYKVTM